jgi:hypothetical protein
MTQVIRDQRSEAQILNPTKNSDREWTRKIANGGGSANRTARFKAVFAFNRVHSRFQFVSWAREKNGEN